MTNTRDLIIIKLMHTPQLRFNELWNQEGPSNTFAYNLKILEEKGLVEKKGEFYELTQLGKEESTYIEGTTGKKTKMPLVAVSIAIRDGDKFLMQQRTKEPFYGYWGFPSGKLDFDYSPSECAKKELEEETGLKNIDLEYKGIQSLKTFNDGKLAYNHQMFIFSGNYNGEKVFKETREGILKWFTEEEIKNLKMFPNIPLIVEFAKKEGASWIEDDRYQENGKFLKGKMKHEQSN